jgi:hypothetical protein
MTNRDGFKYSLLEEDELERETGETLTDEEGKNDEEEEEEEETEKVPEEPVI